MRDRSCLGRAAAVGALVVALAQSLVTAQDYYYPPAPYSHGIQDEVSSTTYRSRLNELEDRLAMLESQNSADKEQEACQEVEIQTAPNHKLRGRLYFDQIWMNDLRGPGGVDTQENQTGFDTIRLGVAGNIYENLAYKAEFEFEGDEVDYKDIYGELGNLPWMGHFRIGYFKEPAGLEQMTSSRFISFMERSAPTVAFTPSRNLGIMFHHAMGARENWKWYAGLYRGQSEDNDEDVDGDTNDWAGTFRVAGLPYYDQATPGRCLLHTGAWISHRRTGDVGGTSGSGDWEGFLELDSRDGPINVDLPADTEFNVMGLELGYMRGPFFIQNEHFFTHVSSVPGGLGFDCYGTYVTVGYFLTGEHRGYNKSNMAFDRVKPFEPFFWVRTADGTAAGLGAWEIAARWSWLDLSDATVATPGTQENITCGLNWYLNPYSRIVFNYVHSVSDVELAGKLEGDHFAVRFQIDW